MANFIFFAVILYYFFVFFAKRIPILSTYTIFGFYWFLYVLVPSMFVNRVLPIEVMVQNYGVYLNTGVIQAYILLNCLFLFVFSSVYLLIFKNPSGQVVDQRRDQWFFFFLMIFSLVPLIILGIKFPYVSDRGWIIHSLLSNLRTVFVGLFVFYLFKEKSVLRVLVVYLFFVAFNFIEGTRQHLIMATIALAFYYKDLKIIKTKHIVVMAVVGLILLNVIGATRTGNRNITLSASVLLVSSVASEGFYASLPSVYVTKLWLEDKIVYYNCFANYLLDPLIAFVPQGFFRAAGENAKEFYNLLGVWEENHAKYISEYGSFTPLGGYHYLAEALSSFGLPGVVIVAFFLALISIRLEKNRFNSFLSMLVYYIYVATVGTTFMRARFYFTFRYFLQTLLVTVILFVAIDILTKIAQKPGSKK
ncbi:MAG: O-antigen polymerase [Candidatus Margulisiibacteriota bacterium]